MRFLVVGFCAESMHMLLYRYAVGVVDDNVMVCCSFFCFCGVLKMLLWELGRGIVLNWGLRLFLVFQKS